MTNTERTEALLACLSGAVDSLKSALEYCDDYETISNVCNALKNAAYALWHCQEEDEDDEAAE
jgi:hypothetical protein